MQGRNRKELRKASRADQGLRWPLRVCRDPSRLGHGTWPPKKNSWGNLRSLAGALEAGALEERALEEQALRGACEERALE